MEIGSSDLLTAAAVIVGFGITVIMFRVQREIQEQEKGEPNWLAWSDYLILGSILLTIGLAILPLLMLPWVSAFTRSLAASACVAAFILQAGYVFGILAHYRIEIGRERKGPREKGEPAERLIVKLSAVFAGIGFAIVMWLHCY
jgi:NADH:ubiquinone oxidoreductase subunit K